MPPSRPAPPPAWKVAGALGILYVVWGSVYLAVRVAVHFWPPFLLVGVRFLCAGLLMLAWALWRRAPWPRGRQWANVGLVGLLMVTGANGAVTWGVFFVDSGLAAVLIASVPLWLIALEALRPRGDRPHWTAGVGLVLGLAGVALLFQPDLGGAARGEALWGQLVLLGGALCWAVGSIFSRQYAMPASVSMSAALQMAFGGAVLVALGLAGGEAARVPGHLELWPSLSFLFMLFCASLMGYNAYQWLIQVTRPGLVATYAYVNPLIAVALGVGVAGEAFTPAMGLGGALVLAAVVLIQRVRA